MNHCSGYRQAIAWDAAGEELFCPDVGSGDLLDGAVDLERSRELTDGEKYQLLTSHHVLSLQLAKVYISLCTASLEMAVV